MRAKSRQINSHRRKGIQLRFIAGFGPIVREPTKSRQLYERDLGIKFEEVEGYLHTEKLGGSNAFALWPLSQAAKSCFGSDQWPADLPIPQAWLEFEVTDVEAATKALEQLGYTLLVANRKEPWGQTVSRFLAPEGLLVGVTHTPWMTDKG